MFSLIFKLNVKLVLKMHNLGVTKWKGIFTVSQLYNPDTFFSFQFVPVFIFYNNEEEGTVPVNKSLLTGTVFRSITSFIKLEFVQILGRGDFEGPPIQICLI